jgi:hypothetical protein
MRLAADEAIEVLKAAAAGRPVIEGPMALLSQTGTS